MRMSKRSISIGDRYHKRWTRKELSILCRIWWVHCHYVGEKGVMHLFRKECREKGIFSTRTKSAIRCKIWDCFKLFNKCPSHCSLLFRTVFDKVWCNLDTP